MALTKHMACRYANASTGTPAKARQAGSVEDAI
jgi:hypothetical protein